MNSGEDVSVYHYKISTIAVTYFYLFTYLIEYIYNLHYNFGGYKN